MVNGVEDKEFLEVEDILKEMEESDPEDIKIITESQEVRQTINTEGWTILKKEIDLEVERLTEKISLTSNMEECYGCSKSKSGLEFVLPL